MRKKLSKKPISKEKFFKNFIKLSNEICRNTDRKEANWIYTSTELYDELVPEIEVDETDVGPVS